MSSLPRLPNKVSFVEQEKTTLKTWKNNKIFEKSLSSRRDKPRYVFYDGPPFATGLPHYGHLLASIIKDIVPRYYAMQGNYVERRFGWDCHGLPVEMEVQKELGLKTSKDIEAYGIEKFNDACKKIVLRYSEQWKETIERIGRWVDFENGFKTMDGDFMESIWWVLHELYKKGLIYKGFKVVAYSWKATTILSNFEANLNYQTTQDPSIIVKFLLKDRGDGGSAESQGLPDRNAEQPQGEGAQSITETRKTTSDPSNDPKDVFFLAWTTTPWTLISNLALGVNVDLTYAEVERLEGEAKTDAAQENDHSKNSTFILAKNLIETVFAKEKVRVIREFSGKELIGKHYEPLFPFAQKSIATHKELAGNKNPLSNSVDPTGAFKNSKTTTAFTILAGSYISDQDGTGIVHIAPAYGEDDFRMGQENGLPHFDPIDRDGFFTDEVPFLAGMNFKEADKGIIRELKKQGQMFSHQTIEHSYPFCWRTDTPLMYKAISTWFVDVTAVKQQLIDNNQTINWVPAHIKNGRFGDWLSEAKDWAISRNRYWGTPIPIWEAEDGEQICFGDVASLEAASGQKIGDLHKPDIDHITVERNGKIFRRVPEVLDCWFESGSMPYAQNHYPFKDKDKFEAQFPADFIAEGLDQTRGWFYTLLVISTCLFGKSSFKNVVVNGLILAKDGKKMSKRLKNYPDPSEILENYGADALRAYLISSQVLKGEPMRFSEDGILMILRGIMIPIWNSLSFLSTYANIDDWTPPQDRSWLHLDSTKLSDPLDQWILSTRETLLHKVNTAMQSYKLDQAVEPLTEFVDKLTNIYIRRSRERFWRKVEKGKLDEDKESAYMTLYSVLKYFSIILAPFMPFLAENIYGALRNGKDAESVHLEDYPNSHPAHRNPALETAFEHVNAIIALGRSARVEVGIRIRQPLNRLTVISADPSVHARIVEYQDMIAHELNIKKIDVVESETDFVTYTAKANFKTLGSKLGQAVQVANKRLMALSSEDIARSLAAGEFVLHADSTNDTSSFTLALEDVIIHRHKKTEHEIFSKGGYSALLDTTLSAQLKNEGLVRDFIHAVQKDRKARDLPYAANIELVVGAEARLRDVIADNEAYIKEQTLAGVIVLAELPENFAKQDTHSKGKDSEEGKDAPEGEDANSIVHSIGETTCTLAINVIDSVKA